MHSFFDFHNASKLHHIQVTSGQTILNQHIIFLKKGFEHWGPKVAILLAERQTNDNIGTSRYFSYISA